MNILREIFIFIFLDIPIGFLIIYNGAFLLGITSPSVRFFVSSFLCGIALFINRLIITPELQMLIVFFCYASLFMFVMKAHPRDALIVTALNMTLKAVGTALIATIAFATNVPLSVATNMLPLKFFMGWLEYLPHLIVLIIAKRYQWTLSRLLIRR